MSGAAQARTKRDLTGAKKQPNEWRGAPSGYSLFAPNPHSAENFWSLLNATEEKIVRWLMSVGKRQENDVWVCGQHSYAAIARGTRLHWTTVKRGIESLRGKQSLDTRAVWAHDKKGGRRMGTLYSIRAFADVLERRRTIPGVAVTAAGSVIYIGRAKRLMTQAKAAEWAINLAKVPSEAKSAAPKTTLHGPAGTAATVVDAPPATGPPEGEIVASKAESLPRVVFTAFKDCVRQRMFGRGVAAQLVQKARKIAVDRNEPLSDHEIANAIYAGWENARRNVQTIAFYNTALPEKVNAMLDARMDERNAMATALPGSGTCPKCHGRGVIQITVRGIGYNQPCECQQQARAAG